MHENIPEPFNPAARALMSVQEEIFWLKLTPNPLVMMGRFRHLEESFKRELSRLSSDIDNLKLLELQEAFEACVEAATYSLIQKDLPLIPAPPPANPFAPMWKCLSSINPEAKVTAAA